MGVASLDRFARSARREAIGLLDLGQRAYSWR